MKPTRAPDIAQPSLDALARDPAQATALSPEERTRSLVQALTAVIALASASPNGPALSPAPLPERMLRVAEAAERLAMSKDFIHRTWKKIPGFFKDVDGRVKIREGDLRKHIERARRR